MPFVVFHFPSESIPFDAKESSFSSETRSFSYTEGFIRINIDTTGHSKSEIDLIIGYKDSIKESFVYNFPNKLDGLLERGQITNISSGDWDYSASSTRVRILNGLTLPLNPGDIIGMTDYTNRNMYIGWKDDYGVSGSTNAWINTDYKVTVKGNYIINLRHADNSITHVEDFLPVLRIYSNTFKNDIPFSELLNGVFSSSRTLYINKEKYNTDTSLQLCIVSKYTGNTAPKFSVSAIKDNGNKALVFTTQFSKNGSYATNIFTLPPLFGNYVKYELSFDIPSGISIDIKEGSITPVVPRYQKIKMDAHLGYSLFESYNSILAFEYAGRSGFENCICNPIADLDGEIWCYHMGNQTVIVDGNVININPTVLHTSEIEGYLQYNSMSEGYPLPKFEDYCRICAKFNMCASLSIDNLRPSYYQKAKNILRKYNLLEGLIVKDGLNSADGDTTENVVKRLETMYSVFGDTTTYEFYFIPCTNEAIDIFAAANLGNAKKIAEPTKADFESLSDDVARQLWCDYAISNGINLAMIQTNAYFDFSRYVKFGFTEFTSDTVSKMWY